MDWLKTVWARLANADKRARRGWLGGGIVVIISAIWQIYRHRDAKKTKALEQAQQSKGLTTDKTASIPPFPPSGTTARRTDYLRFMAREW
jgi:hypothetical protein